MGSERHGPWGKITLRHSHLGCLEFGGMYWKEKGWKVHKAIHTHWWMGLDWALVMRRPTWTERQAERNRTNSMCIDDNDRELIARWRKSGMREELLQSYLLDRMTRRIDYLVDEIKARG